MGETMTGEEAAPPPQDAPATAASDKETEPANAADPPTETSPEPPAEEEEENDPQTTAKDEAEEEEEEEEDPQTAAEKAERARIAELERRAVAEATASADASYVPTPSLLNASTAQPLLDQVDGPSLVQYSGAENVYVGRMVPVALRGKIDVPIHVTAGGSVVEYAVETSDYDISFGVTAEREEGVTIVKETGRVDSHITPVTGKFLVGSVPCALVFTFDNEYSWFREKLVSYRITVSPPTVDNVKAGRRRRAKAALKAVQDDRAGAETRLERASSKRLGLAGEIERMEKELAEKRKGLEVATKEEEWLKKRVELRSSQEDLLSSRLENGWEDEREAEEEGNGS